ncbi:MAG: sugar transferase [Pseudomonadota bacterium]
MFDFQSSDAGSTLQAASATGHFNATPRRRLSKIIFDDVLAILLLLPLTLVGLVLLLLNPLLNPGKLVYRQTRMGQGCQPFTAYKFRTMSAAEGPARGAFDRVEDARISGFARVLRKMRIDELPQIINVLRGEMSLIGPRPDLYEHAQVYLESVPGYAERHRAMPGITGYAQVTVGYVEEVEGVARKVAADHHYIGHASFALDLWIAWRTIGVIILRRGC